MASEIQLRRDTSNNWIAINPLLAQGEIGIDLTTNQIKIGTGVDNWVDLPYFGGGNGTGGYGNSNVEAFLASARVSNIIPDGNAIYSLGNATNQWKDLWISSNTIYMNTIPISLTNTNDLTVNGNPVVTANSAANGATNVNAISVSGNLSAQEATIANTTISNGNITANYFIGDGSLLTGLPAGYANSDAANYFASGNVTTNVITSGNITAGYFIGDGSQLTGLPAGYANSNVADYFASGNVTTDIITDGNVTANYFLGNIAFATGGYSNTD